MFLSAKTFFDNQSDNNIRLIRQAETQIPADFVRLFKKNVAPITPKDTGYLRKSIITQALGNTAKISWRAPYAKAQDEGGHRVDKPIKGTNKRDGGFGIIPPAEYRYSQYTTPGTGPNFATKAFRATAAMMPAVLRQRGLIK